MSEQTMQKTDVEALERFLARRSEPDWLSEARHAALDRFRNLSWPSTEDEEFRRSDVSNYNFDGYSAEIGNGVPAAVENPVGQSGSLSFTGAAAVRRSLAEGLADKGVHFLSIQEAISGTLPPAVEERLGAALLAGIANADNKLALWHYATITHGAIIYVPPFLELTDPFVVTFEESADGLLRSPELLVVGDEGARFSVLQRVRGSEEGEILFNEGLDITVGDAGQISYFAVQDVNIDSSYISNGLGRVGRDANLKAYSAVFGGMLSKYRFDVEMRGEGGDAFLSGVYFPHEDQHVDLRTVQRHVSPRAHSLTLYKGAATDEAHSVFQGLIEVDHDALFTDAYLTNNNLLLSDDARSDSIPTLQIQTDEVRCSHGSTTGKLDDRHLYYLKTRGYNPEEARQMLVEGFFEEIVSHFPEIVVDEIRGVVKGRIAGE